VEDKGSLSRGSLYREREPYFSLSQERALERESIHKKRIRVLFIERESPLERELT